MALAYEHYISGLDVSPIKLSVKNSQCTHKVYVQGDLERKLVFRYLNWNLRLN